MSDSYLLKSYAETEREKVRKAAQAAEIEAGLRGIEPAALGTPAPTQPAKPAFEPPQRDPGVVASVKRGLFAIPERFFEGGKQFLAGGKQVADAIYARDQRLTGVADAGLQQFLTLGPVQMGLGLLNVVFPFGGFAKETGGDFGQWAAKANGMLTNERLRERLLAVEANAPSAPIGEGAAELSAVDRAASGGEADVIRNLLAMPEAQRLEQFREFSGSMAEALSGTIPGYTAPATPHRR